MEAINLAILVKHIDYLVLSEESPLDNGGVNLHWSHDSIQLDNASRLLHMAMFS